MQRVPLLVIILWIYPPQAVGRPLGPARDIMARYTAREYLGELTQYKEK